MLNVYHIIKRFNRIAADYEAAAVVAQEAAQGLIARLQGIRLQPTWILDAGCGTGIMTRCLAQQYPEAKLLGCDIAFNMLQQGVTEDSAMRRINADVYHLPLMAQQFDLIVANLLLPWCHDLASVLAEFRRLLKPQGLLLFSTLGPDTWRELQAARAQAKLAASHFYLPDLHNLGDLLLQAGYAAPVLDTDHLTLAYRASAELWRELRQAGNGNVLSHRAAGLQGKQAWRNMQASYEGYRLPDGTLPVSYEIIYGHAWIPEMAKTVTMGEDAVVHFPLSKLRRK